MGKTIAAVTGGVVLGLAIAFANAGAFQFPWGSDNSNPQASSQSQAPQNQSQMRHQPAPPNAPEPNEPAVALPSWAPLVKRVMPTVVNVAVVQEVKSSGFPFGGDSGDEGQGQGQGQGPGMGPQGPGGNPFGQGNPFGGDPFEQFRHFFGQMPRNYKEHGLGSG